MGITTAPLLPSSLTSHQSKHHHHHHNCVNPISMSQDYHHHHSIFSFPNGFERSQQEQQQQQQHTAQQIRRDKLRVQGFQPPQPLVAIEEVESSGLPGGGRYETAGMLSEMFNFPPPATAAGVGSEWYSNNNNNTRQGEMVVGGGGLGPLVQSKDHHHENVGTDRDTIANTYTHHHHNDHHQQQHMHHQHRQQHISGINADTAAAMQLFLMNPQPRSPSPSPSHPPPPPNSTLHMLLPNTSPTSTLHHHHGFHNHPSASPSGAPTFGSSQFTWVPDSANGASTVLVEGQGLSLSLSSSLHPHLDAAKAEDLRISDGSRMMFFNQEPSGALYKNLGQHHQGFHVQGGFGLTASSMGAVNVLRNSKYAKAAQELLEEFCSVGRGKLRKTKLGKNNTNNNNPSSNPSGGGAVARGGGGGNSSSSSKDHPPLSAADRLEHQRRKVKLLSMLDEVDRRYNHYCEQMQMVVNSFDLVMGFGAALPYTALAQKAMSRHFRCLKDAISAQLKHSCEVLGDKDAGTSGLTKGETPRLKLLEQSLRQQRAFHQMGMMEQEAWRPQRGLPERSVNILRAWLFEHFLHPYPSDADKHLLARQTGLSRNQVSNWFINARVRLWKPMVEEMYQKEGKDEDEDENEDKKMSQNNNNAQTPKSNTITTPTTATTSPATTATTTAVAEASAAITATGKRSEINDPENDPSLIAINRQCFPENQAKQQLLQQQPTNISPFTTSASIMPLMISATTVLHESAAFRRSGVVAGYGTTAYGGGADNTNSMGSTLIRFGTSSGDVSLTLGLRHAGNMPEKSSFSVRDFGDC